ncbi:MAG: hypothetical protein ALECFALPRED_009306 [Alectoria fallacina]|uniref:Plus3 domain-containing protein n=1 Tax=Alectoria fallacina TaxID=1903189 RepID=A0A8H3J7B2_9LECA|nr:MAG: hypothetical protein ALECFALPRED_009306 [Alectoria fallacina]
MEVDDAELLALAGGDDSSDEETTEAPPTAAKAISPIPTIALSPPHVKDRSSATPNASAKRGSASKAVKNRKAESEDEGEASSAPGSPDSLQSAPMSESDSDASPANGAGAGGPIFPVDNKFYSEQDKRKIMALSEIERESILADRAQILERNVQDQHLRRLLQTRGNADTRSADKKRKIGTTDLEESPRKSSRQKTTLGGRKVGETSAAIDAYKRQREEKSLRDQQRKRDGANQKDRRARSSSENKYSSADAEGESEVEWDDGKLKVDDYKFRNAQPADYNDVRRVTLSRGLLADYCFHPGFGDAVKDFYVRLPSEPKITGEMNYELMLIKGVLEKEGVDYAVERPNGKKIVTNQHVQLTVDGAVKDIHFAAISNSRPTEAEVANYKNAMSDAGKTLPTRSFLISKLADFDTVVKHRFTDEELTEKLKRQGVMQKKDAYFERNSINARRRAAEAKGDEVAIAKCDVELAALNGPKLRYGTFLIDPRAKPVVPAGPTQQERLAELNRANRKANRENVRKAQLAERKADRINREAVQRGEAMPNSFARVKTYAKTHHDAHETLNPLLARQKGNSRDSRSATPAAVTTPKIEATKPVFPSPAQKFTTSGMPILGNRNMDDEIIAAMDLGIDIEI